VGAIRTVRTTERVTMPEASDTIIPVERLITLSEAKAMLSDRVSIAGLRSWLGSRLTEYNIGEKVFVDADEVAALVQRAPAPREVA